MFAIPQHGLLLSTSPDTSYATWSGDSHQADSASTDAQSQRLGVPAAGLRQWNTLSNNIHLSYAERRFGHVSYLGADI